MSRSDHTGGVDSDWFTGQWGAYCDCLWENPEFETDHQAVAALRNHQANARLSDNRSEGELSNG